ncbi:hypothetical protein, partial [Natrialba sp. PRR66]
MAPDNSQGTTTISVRVPTNHAEALFQIAQERSSRVDRTTQSDVVREYIQDGLTRDAQSGEVPQEVLDLLDVDLEANAGGDEKST